MSPVAKGPQGDTRKAVAVAVSGVAAAVLLALAVVFLAGRGGEVEIKLGDDVFRAGNAEDFAATIAEDMRPIAYSSLAGEDRPLFLQHQGDDPDTGWIGIIAVSPTKGSSCLIQWDLDAQDFYEECDESVRFPADGAGLETVPVTVTNNAIIVDINNNAAEADTE